MANGIFEVMESEQVMTDEAALAYGRLVGEFLSTKARLVELVTEARRIGATLWGTGERLQQLQPPPSTMCVPAQEIQFEQILKNPEKTTSLLSDLNETSQKYLELREQMRSLGLDA